MVMMADRFMQTAVQPLKGSTSNIGQMVSQIQAAAAMSSVVVNGAKQSFVNTTGGLKGCSHGLQQRLADSAQQYLGAGAIEHLPGSRSRNDDSRPHDSGYPPRLGKHDSQRQGHGAFGVLSEADESPDRRHECPDGHHCQHSGTEHTDPTGHRRDDLQQQPARSRRCELCCSDSCREPDPQRHAVQRLALPSLSPTARCRPFLPQSQHRPAMCKRF